PAVDVKGRLNRFKRGIGEADRSRKHVVMRIEEVIPLRAAQGRDSACKEIAGHKRVSNLRSKRNKGTASDELSRRWMRERVVAHERSEAVAADDLRIEFLNLCDQART